MKNRFTNGSERWYTVGVVNFELYKIFYAVARCGSLTRAAEELHISQPAVSQAIKQLEMQLGTQLFRRKHKGMELTALGGKQIFDDVESAVRMLGGVEERMAEWTQSATGTVRIGASDTIFQYVLADTIVEYNARYPAVQIELLSDVSPKIIEALKSDRCDIGFLNLPIEPDNGVTITDSIMHLHDIFIAGKRFASVCEKEIPLKELQRYPILLMEEHTAAREAFDAYTQSHGVRLRPAVEVNSWGFMKRLITAGMGIGCIPREYTQRRLHDGSVLELHVTPPAPVRSVGMALPKNRNLSFALQLFIRLLKSKRAEKTVVTE